MKMLETPEEKLARRLAKKVSLFGAVSSAHIAEWGNMGCGA